MKLKTFLLWITGLLAIQGFGLAAISAFGPHESDRSFELQMIGYGATALVMFLLVLFVKPRSKRA